MTSQETAEIESPTKAVLDSAGASMAIASALFTALQAKHAPTAFHCLRVGQNITAWGLFHNLPMAQLTNFEVLGLLHDIGKIGVPERILQKPSKLTDEERAIMAVHPKVGVEILRSAGLTDSIVQSVDCIGEWFDGTNATGVASKLPFASRILAIADAFDSMITEQRYRKRLSKADALAELIKKSGTQFDPKLVHSFVAVAEKYDSKLHEAVQQRWENHGFIENVVRLFSHENILQYGGVATNSLTSIFHHRLTDHMNDGVIFIDTEGKIVEWNRAAEALSGRSRSVLCHQQWHPELIGMRDESGAEIQSTACPLRDVLATSRFNVRRLSVQHRDGSRRAIQVQFMPVNDDRGVLRGAAMIFDDITRQKNLEQAVQHLHQRASRDPLTKVFNRAELNLQLTRFTELAASRTMPVSIIICDIDFFKRINDTYGHAAGDEALVTFASILKECARSSDLVARYGGEEFVIVCGDCDADSALQKAEEIRKTIAATPLPVLRGKCLSASFGVAQIIPGESGQDTINLADSALLRAKQNGRNRVELGCPKQDERPAPVDQAEPQASSTWLQWLGNRTVDRSKTCDILTSVPQEIAIQKIGGFLDDWQAELIDSEDDKITVRLDTRKAPQYARLTDRDACFTLEIKLQEVEYLPDDERVAAKMQTMITSCLKTTSRRDRRLGNINELMQHVLESMNRYLVGEIVDDKKRQCIRIHSRR